jgi:hypothetical protein
MIAKKQEISDIERKTIVYLSASGKTVEDIAKQLRMDGRIVSGIVAARRREIKAMAKGRQAGPEPLPFPTKEDQLKTLAKAWRDSEPEAEFSLHTEKGQAAYVAQYKGGVVLRVGEQKKVAFLTSGMAMRFGSKLMEMAQWSNQSNIR